MGQPTTTQAGPISTVIYRRARAGHQADYERILHHMIAAAKAFPGHLDATVVRPQDDDLGYVVIFRFETTHQLEDWLSSDIRSQLLNQIKPHTDSEPQVAKQTGLEVWFDRLRAKTPSPGPPPRPKMALVIWMGNFPIVLALAYLAPHLIGSWSIVWRSLITSGITVALLTWIVMPVLTRLLAPWLKAKS